MKPLPKISLIRSMRRPHAIVVALALAILAGCASVGPNYVRPEISVSKGWHSPLEAGLTEEAARPEKLSTWWTTLNDAELSNLIDRAVAGSLDVKKARAKVREARAQRAVAKASFFPTLDAQASATRNWVGESSTSSENALIAAGASTGGSGTVYNAGFDASWEVDIFGGVRRSVEAAQGDLEASIENLRDVLVSLLAEVATNYVEVRTYQARLGVAQENLKAQNETYQLTEWQHQAGLSDELAVQQARYNLETTRSQIPALNTGLENAMNRIAVLLGEQPGTIHGELKVSGPCAGHATQSRRGYTGRHTPPPSGCAASGTSTCRADRKGGCRNGGPLPHTDPKRLHRPRGTLLSQ